MDEHRLERLQTCPFSKRGEKADVAAEQRLKSGADRTGWEYHCNVIAPSLIPIKPGVQRKYDKYDAAQYGSPPSDSGGTHMIESLDMLELLDLPRMGPPPASGETLCGMNRIVNETFVAGGSTQTRRRTTCRST